MVTYESEQVLESPLRELLGDILTFAAVIVAGLVFNLVVLNYHAVDTLQDTTIVATR